MREMSTGWTTHWSVTSPSALSKERFLRNVFFFFCNEWSVCFHLQLACPNIAIQNADQKTNLTIGMNLNLDLEDCMKRTLLMKSPEYLYTSVLIKHTLQQFGKVSSELTIDRSKAVVLSDVQVKVSWNTEHPQSRLCELFHPLSALV